MRAIPEELYYTETHQWIRYESDDVVVVGITEYAQQQLGDVVSVELPDSDADVHASDDVGVIESTKAAADFFAPLSGTVLEINEDLFESPSLLNRDPYGDGWLFTLAIADNTEAKMLLDHEAYAEQVEAEAGEEEDEHDEYDEHDE